MIPLNAAIALVFTAVLGTVAVLSLAAAYDFLARTRMGLVSPTPAADGDDGLVKVRGTVAADATLEPAVADTGTVMSHITLSRQEGLSGKVAGSWEEAKELLRAVPFEVVDESGSVPVEHEDDPHQSGFRGLSRTTTLELDGGAEVPDAIYAAFTEPEPDVDAVIEALEAEGDDEASELADELRQAQTDGGTAAEGGTAAGVGSATDVLDEASPLRAGVPQKFEERFAAPDDEVYVVGKARDGRITNGSGTFQVLHDPRSKFQLLKGLAGGLALAGVGLAAGYGTVNWLLQTGRELFTVVAFIG